MSNVCTYSFPCINICNINECIIIGQHNCLDFVTYFNIESHAVDHKFIGHKLLQMLNFKNSRTLKKFCF